MYIDCDLAAHHVWLVGDLIFALTDEVEVEPVPVLRRALAFPELVP